MRMELLGNSNRHRYGWYFRLFDLDDNDGILDSVETGIDTDADGIRIIAIWIVTTTCVAML
jgi:hypothetical protein